MKEQNLIALFESITDDEAEKMPPLFKQLRVAYLEWKSTGKLPNEEQWSPKKS